MHTPGLGVVWDSKCGVYPPYRRAHHTVLPTKTSRQCIQFAGISIVLLKVGSQVSSINFVNLLVCFIFIAVTLSMVSLSLIVQCHLALISPSERFFSCMTLSHLNVHIRYANSNRRICVVSILGCLYMQSPTLGFAALLLGR